MVQNMFVSLLILLQLASVSNPTPGKREKALATVPGLVAAVAVQNLSITSVGVRQGAQIKLPIVS